MSDTSPSVDGLTEVMTLHEACNEGISVRGMYEPCEAVAVAVRVDPEFRTAYPVCGRHARGELVPLAEVVRAASSTEIARLRAVIEKAPHGGDCWLQEDPDEGVLPAHRRCTCWKAAAL
jgi:hypothetical protein